MLAMLIGCGLRRGELLALRVNSIQLREADAHASPECLATNNSPPNAATAIAP